MQMFSNYNKNRNCITFTASRVNVSDDQWVQDYFCSEILVLISYRLMASFITHNAIRLPAQSGANGI